MISEKKYLILRHCNIVPSGPTITAETTGLGVKEACTVMYRLFENEMLTNEDGVYSTTMLGRIEMRLYEEAQRRVVPAPRIDKFDGHYTPTTGYQRNNGNKEIQSRGFPC